MTINCDATVKDGLPNEIGFVIRDDKGISCGLSAKIVQRSNDVELIEAEAIAWALYSLSSSLNNRAQTHSIPIEIKDPNPEQMGHERDHNHTHLPKRIILVRHGESQGNLDTKAYSTTPDNKIPLTPTGIQEARLAGSEIKTLISQYASSSSSSWRVYFYVSPYERTRSTLREIGRAFPKGRIIGVREECRIREQDFGNFQVEERMRAVMETRLKFGRFFYRFPEGESAADVYDRVSSFMESLWRDIDMNRLHHDPSQDLNLIIVTHGLTERVFLMKWFKWTVEQFECLNNPKNCEYRVMQLGEGGEYSLALCHTNEEMLEWGLTPEMIAEQNWRAHAKRGSQWIDKCPWYLDDFFDNLPESDNVPEADDGVFQDCNDLELHCN